MVADPTLYTEAPFMTSTWYEVNRRLGRKLILHALGKKGGVLSATLMLKGLKGTNITECTWHIKSITLSFACALNQWSSIFSGTSGQLHGRQLFHRLLGSSGGWDGLGIIQTHYIYCEFYFYYYYISSTSDHQALDPRVWGPLL